jgi:hypothetical protein
MENRIVRVFTLTSVGSFPARARRKVLFPEPGGPNSNVILPTNVGGFHVIAYWQIVLGHEVTEYQ